MIDVTRADGSLVSRSFESSRKAEFSNRVQQQGKPEWFTNFQDLNDIVSEILRLSEQS